MGITGTTTIALAKPEARAPGGAGATDVQQRIDLFSGLNQNNLLTDS